MRAELQAGNLLQKSGGRPSRNDGQYNDSPSALFDGAAFKRIEGFQGIVSTLYVNIGFGKNQESGGPLVREYAHTANALQGRNQSSAIVLPVYRAAFAFQLFYRLIAVQTDQQQIAKVSRRFQISRMSKMQKVETAVGDNQFLSCSASRCAPGGQIIPVD